MEKQKHPKVFIPYSHVDDFFEQKMYDFANRLRNDGIDANIDLYEDAPQEGWPRWMEKQIAEADYVLVVASESYWEKCYGTKGKGISWEVNIVYQKLYDSNCETNKFIPVFWDEGDEEYILTPIKSFTYYNIGTDKGYTDLWKYLLGIPKYQKPEIGKIDIHKYDSLPKKSRRTMFFSTPIDLEKWNTARWKGMIYLLSPDDSFPPILGLLFMNYEAGIKIFEQWKESYQGRVPDDYLKITYIVPPLPKDCYVYSDPEKSFGKGYFVHIGVNEDKAIERAFDSCVRHDEMFLTFISRYIWVDEVNGTWNRKTFFKQLKQFNQYTLIPVGLRDENKGIQPDNIIVGQDHGIILHSAFCKRGIDVNENDQCKAVLSKPSEEW